MRAITTNHVELIDLLVVQKLQNFVEVKATSRTAQDGTTGMMNVLDDVGCQNDGLQGFIVKATKAALNAIDFAYNCIVVVVRRKKNDGYR